MMPNSVIDEDSSPSAMHLEVASAVKISAILVRQACLDGLQNIFLAP